MWQILQCARVRAPATAAKTTASNNPPTSRRSWLLKSPTFFSSNEGENSPNANDRKIHLDIEKYVLFFEAFWGYKEVCKAKRDSHRHLSATCQEALELWEHPKQLPDGSLDDKLSSELVQVMLFEHNQRRFRSRLPMRFRRMTENHPKLQACVVVICIALATFIYMAADETRQPGFDGMQTALRMSLRWRFSDSFDTRSWNTWGTLLGISLHFLLTSYSFPWEDDYTLNGGILAFVSCLIVRVAITDFAVPWLTAYTLVRLARWAFACKWHLESPWQLDEVYQEPQNILFSGMIIGIFMAGCFENILYLSGYWGLLRDEDWKRLEL